MRHNPPVSLSRLSLLAITLWFGSLTVSAQPTAFSYQGQLNDGGSPANGSYDIQFKLFDALTAGTQVGSTVPLTSVSVSNGVFNVTLDFGASAFPGANRWLEISVRLAGSGTYTTLTPRQAITSTPYAIKSLSTATADGLSPACQGCVTSAQIGSLPANSGNYIQNTTTQQTANFNISGNGAIGGKVGIGIGPDQALRKLHVVESTSNLLFGHEGAAVLRVTNGEPSSIAALNLGNTARDWQLRIDGTDANKFRIYDATAIAPRLTIDANGNVGIGTTQPETRLDTAGTIRSTAQTVPTSGEGLEVIYSAGQGYLTSYNRGSNGGYRPLNLDGSVLSLNANPATIGAFVGIGTTMPKAKLDTAGTIRSTAQTVPTSGEGLEVIYSAGQGYLTSYDRTGNTYKPLNLDGSVLLLNTNSANPNAKVGIGTPTPGSKLSVVSHDIVPAISAYNDGGDVELNPTTGIRGQSVSGTGVEGFGLHTGVYGSGNYGVRGVGGDIGVIGVGPSSGVSGSSNSGSGVVGSTSASGGIYAGVSGYANSNDGHGVNGVATGNDGHGVDGRAFGLDGIGVFGQANNGPNAYGVWGISSSGQAGTFWGNVGISGNLSKGGGSFKIDHPLDPENKYLYHSFVESPDMMNIYNGNVTTNAEGEATVTMPDYFEALNRDFRYQLTVIGQFAQAIVASKINGNSFTIKTDKPNVEVSWQVTGVRQDGYANKHRIQVEEAKPERDRGTYLYPEAFGQPEEKSVEWARHPEMMRKMKEQREKSQQANQSQQR